MGSRSTTEPHQPGGRLGIFTVLVPWAGEELWADCDRPPPRLLSVPLFPQPSNGDGTRRLWPGQAPKGAWCGGAAGPPRGPPASSRRCQAPTGTAKSPSSPRLTPGCPPAGAVPVHPDTASGGRFMWPRRCQWVSVPRCHHRPPAPARGSRPLLTPHLVGARPTGAGPGAAMEGDTQSAGGGAPPELPAAPPEGQAHVGDTAPLVLSSAPLAGAAAAVFPPDTGSQLAAGGRGRRGWDHADLFQ